MEKYEELLAELEKNIDNDDFWNIEENIINKLSQDYSANELLIPFFNLMEKYPLVEWGMPGAIVHFAESADAALYSKCLIESLNRQPTMHTVWMLNRTMNGAVGDEKNKYLTVMQQIADNADLPKEIQDSAKDFIGYQNESNSAKPINNIPMSLSDIFSAFNFTPKKKD